MIPAAVMVKAKGERKCVTRGTLLGCDYVDTPVIEHSVVWVPEIFHRLRWDLTPESSVASRLIGAYLGHRPAFNPPAQRSCRG